MFFDPFTETTERLYILLGQLALKKRKILLIYIQWKSVRQIMKRLNSLRQQIKGRKKIWQLVGVTSSECFGEFIKIDNISLKTKQEITHR